MGYDIGRENIAKSFEVIFKKLNAFAHALAWLAWNNGHGI
jgi:hypothetical protein